MKLNAPLIVWHLKKMYSVRASGKLNPEPKLLYPVLYTETEPLQDGRIYVVTDPDFELPSHRLTELFIIFTGAEFSISEDDYPNICILPPGCDGPGVLSFLQETFCFYDKWNQTLIESRLSGGSVQELLDLSEDIIPNPIVLISMDFTVTASKNTEPGISNGVVLGGDDDTLPLVDSLKNDSEYTGAFEREGFFYFSGNEVAVPSLCVNIMNNGRATYRLLITKGEAPLDATFGFVLEYLAHFISHALSTNSMGSQDYRYPRHQIFTTLLTDPSADYVEVSRQLSDTGWLSSEYYLCVLIKTSPADRGSLTLHSVCRYVENTIPASCAVEHDGNAVVYINLDQCPLSMNGITEKLESFLQNSMLNAGYSRKMLGHFNFHRQYVQAGVSLQVGKRRNPASCSHFFNTIALPYILEQATKKLPAYMVSHEKLLSLKYADEENNSRLYETLRVYLDNHRNITRTSEALYIHRSTLLYRLDKIKAALGTDFSDPDEVLYIMISFRLMDFEEHQPKR